MGCIISITTRCVTDNSLLTNFQFTNYCNLLQKLYMLLLSDRIFLFFRLGASLCLYVGMTWWRDDDQQYPAIFDNHLPEVISITFYAQDEDTLLLCPVEQLKVVLWTFCWNNYHELLNCKWHWLDWRCGLNLNHLKLIVETVSEVSLCKQNVTILLVIPVLVRMSDQYDFVLSLLLSYISNLLIMSPFFLL